MISKETVESLCDRRENGYCTIKFVLSELSLKESTIPGLAEEAKRDWESVDALYKETLDDICNRPECKGEYCPSKGIIFENHTPLRTLEQVKCIEKFKWEESERHSGELGWKDAVVIWISGGEKSYAAAFNNVYKDGMKNGELYALVMKEYQTMQEQAEVRNAA